MSDKQSSGLGFWKWGINNVAWTLVGALATSAGAKLGESGIEEVVAKAQTACIQVADSDKAACAAKSFNERSVLYARGDKNREIRFQVGETPVKLHADTIISCEGKSCKESLVYRPG